MTCNPVMLTDSEREYAIQLLLKDLHETNWCLRNGDADVRGVCEDSIPIIHSLLGKLKLDKKETGNG